MEQNPIQFIEEADCPYILKEFSIDLLKELEEEKLNIREPTINFTENEININWEYVNIWVNTNGFIYLNCNFDVFSATFQFDAGENFSKLPNAFGEFLLRFLKGKNCDC